MSLFLYRRTVYVFLPDIPGILQLLDWLVLPYLIFKLQVTSQVKLKTQKNIFVFLTFTTKTNSCIQHFTVSNLLWEHQNLNPSFQMGRLLLSSIKPPFMFSIRRKFDLEDPPSNLYKPRAWHELGQSFPPIIDCKFLFNWVPNRSV